MKPSVRLFSELNQAAIRSWAKPVTVKQGFTILYLVGAACVWANQWAMSVKIDAEATVVKAKLKCLDDEMTADLSVLEADFRILKREVDSLNTKVDFMTIKLDEVLKRLSTPPKR